MEILILLAFVSVSMAAAAVALFGYSARSGHYEHADRMSLLPIEADEPPRESRVPPADSAPNPSRKAP